MIRVRPRDRSSILVSMPTRPVGLLATARVDPRRVGLRGQITKRCPSLCDGQCWWMLTWVSWARKSGAGLVDEERTSSTALCRGAQIVTPRTGFPSLIACVYEAQLHRNACSGLLMSCARGMGLIAAVSMLRFLLQCWRASLCGVRCIGCRHAEEAGRPGFH